MIMTGTTILLRFKLKKILKKSREENIFSDWAMQLFVEFGLQHFNNILI